jgi:D-amino peptidase
VLIDELDDRCRLVAGGAGPLNFLQGMDPDCAGIFFTGFHAKAGTDASALSHTWSTNLNDLRIAGKSTGEFGLIAYVAGAFGVPVLLVTGDRAACEQTSEFLGGRVAQAIVKEGISQTGAINLHPRKGQALIEQRGTEAMRLIGKARPTVLPANSTVEFDFDHQVRADAAAKNHGVTRIGERSVSFVANDGVELLNQFLTVMRSSYVRISP